MTKIQMYLAVSTIVTMLPTILVTASPLPSLTRDNVTRPKKYDPKVVKYLVQYGHLDNKPDVRNFLLSQKLKQQPNMAEPSNNPEIKHDVFHLYTDDEISNGIKSFRNSLGLKVSGDLDEETITMMKTLRCGVTDEDNNLFNAFKLKVHHRSRRYAILHKLSSGKMVKYTWKKKRLTWNILIYYKYLTKQVQVETLEKAFNIWEYSSSIKFIKSSDKYPDIRIEFGSGNHGDNRNFDGKGKVLAHAFPPTGGSLAGDIHFDADESWNKDFDLFSVALHEIGHSLGLAHSKVPPSVMYHKYQKQTTLHWDDRDGIRALYGPCEARIDAAIYLFGDVYFLRKDLIWKIDEFDLSNSFDKGFPKKIKDEILPGVPNDVDAALTWSDYLVYFLKGSRSYGYDQFEKKIAFDRTIAHDWPKIPNSPDAALCYTYDEITWFFKGDECWKMNDYNLTVFYGYPKKISKDWPGVPDNIDAAYYSHFNKETYFFKGTEYWVVDNGQYSKAPYRAYPGGKINQKWKGVCSEKY